MKLWLVCAVMFVELSFASAAEPIQMQRLWQRELGGDSGPIVATEQGVIVGSLESNGQHRATLSCYSHADGALLWRKYHQRIKDRFLDNLASGLRSRPLVMGDRLVYFSNDALVVCLDTKRGVEDVWKVDLRRTFGVFKRDDLGMGCPGISASLVDGNLLVATGNGSTHNMHDRRKTIPAPDAPAWICVDVATGETKWTNNAPSQNVVHSTVAGLSKLSGDLLVSTGGDGEIYVLEAATGDVFFKSKTGGFWSWAAPAVSNEFVVVALSHPPGTKLTSRGSVSCFKTADLSSGRDARPSWTFSAPPYDGSLFSPVIVGGSTFVLTQSIELLELETDSGKLISQRPLDTFERSGIQKVGSLVAVATDNLVHLFAPRRKQPVRTYALPDFIDGPFLFRTNRIFVAGSKSLRAYTLAAAKTPITE